ncbi:MAG: OmpA family protein [Desulfobacterales bacterium]|nr:OmpA family protein [Desulfobacterales bacterium]
MRRMNSLVGCVIIALGWSVLTSCAIFSKPPQPIEPPAPFEEAISALAGDLLARIKADRPDSTGKDKIHVMLIPFADADTDEVPQVSRQIETIFITEGSQKFKGFELARLTSKNISQIDYIISGTLRMDLYPGKHDEKVQKYYRAHGEVTRLKDKKIIGKSSRWIADLDINVVPTPIYRDSPLYLKGSRLPTPDKTPQILRDENFIDTSLETTAILIEGRMAYENGNYEGAESLFRMAAGRKDGQRMDTYAGLYLANYKLGRLEEAEKAFSRLVAISAEKYRSFTVKYLFGVNSVEFLKDKTLADRYQTWIRNIGKYFHQTNTCLKIVGHSSRTGSEEYNDKLSLERAKSVQALLQKYFPEVFQRSEIVGKGFSENIVGTGTDDDSDALDRRVELFVVECK